MRGRLTPRAVALRGVFALSVTALVLLLALPLLGLVLRVPPRELVARLGEPVVLQALRLSLYTSVSAAFAAALLGLPAAWLLASRRFRGKRVLEVLIDLPLVLPPTVAGFALLMAFGRMGLAGRTLGAFGVSLPFTTLGVVLAQTFMAVPFFVMAARAGFAGVDRRYLDAAATLRASEAYTFFRVVLPLSAPSILAGAAMAWARALGEFGATITFAGNLPGVTQTMPLAVYLELQENLGAAAALSLILVVLAIALLLALRTLPFGPVPGRADAGR